MKVTVIYRGEIEMETNAPDQETAEDTVLDEIETWSEALFLERLELTIEDVKFEEQLLYFTDGEIPSPLLTHGGSVIYFQRKVH